ncbi:MAG: hypothetical protein OHK0046_27680 [Anaerolineae bacterium]
MQTQFLHKLSTQSSRVMLLLRPQMLRMPLPMKRHDDPFFPFGKAIIDATRDLVGGYMFDLAAYMRWGAAGAIALERTISYTLGEPLTVLHGPFTGAGYAEITDENAFGVDALTVTALDAAYLARPDRSVLVMGAELPAAAGVGCYDEAQGIILIQHDPVIRLAVLGDEIIYASAGDDYATKAREVLEAHIKGTPSESAL